MSAGAGMLTFTARLIVLPLAAIGNESMSLDMAAELAVRMQAELKVLFIEDADMLRMAASPLARTMHLYSASRTETDAGTLERELKVRANLARDQLATIAGRRNLRWSFDISRRRLIEAVFEVVAETEVAIMSRSARMSGPSLPILKLMAGASGMEELQTLLRQIQNPILLVR